MEASKKWRVTRAKRLYGKLNAHDKGIPSICTLTKCLMLRCASNWMQENIQLNEERRTNTYLNTVSRSCKKIDTIGVPAHQRTATKWAGYRSLNRTDFVSHAHYMYFQWQWMTTGRNTNCLIVRRFWCIVYHFINCNYLPMLTKLRTKLSFLSIKD